MARENIEDVIKKVILGEGFLAETAQDPDPTEDEDTSEEDASADEGFEVEEIDEAKCDAEEEDEDESEDEESEEEEDEPKGKKKMPAFLKGKFGKKGKSEMEEAVSDYASTNITHDVNKKGAKIAEPTGDASGKNKGTIKAKPSAAKAETKIPEIKPTVKEDIAAMLTGEDLSEEFKTSAATLFEAHLAERVYQIEEELKGQYEDLLEQHTVAVTEELVERIDDYLNYVVEEWMQENRLAVEKGLRTEITENFISNLKGLFTESYIEVPEDKLDLFESTVDQAEALDSELQGQVEKNMELSEEVEQLKCEIIFREISEGMTDTEVEKLRRLAEDLEFDTIEQFAEKIGVLCENIGSIGTVAEEASSEEGLEESYEDASEATPLVEAYVRSMSKSRE
jgi:hypothetical protein